MRIFLIHNFCRYDPNHKRKTVEKDKSGSLVENEKQSVEIVSLGVGTAVNKSKETNGDEKTPSATVPKSRSGLNSLATERELIFHKRYEEREVSDRNKLLGPSYAYEHMRKSNDRISERAAIPEDYASHTSDSYDSNRLEAKQYVDGLFR